MKKNNKINVVSLGCYKNLVDSEELLGTLAALGLEVIHESKEDNFNTVIINTCGFIGDAKEESINTVLRFLDAKKEKQIERVYVMGCLSQRYREELQKEMPDVDGFFGTNGLVEIIKMLKPDYKKELIGERQITTPKHYAYLKISEGCSNDCSFCSIPIMRGKHQSKTIERIIADATLLAVQGVKEIILIAQDLTYYGLDLYKKRRIADLLRELVKIKGIEWIRLQYAYPFDFPMELLEVMKSEPKICKYLDISFQHIDTEVLKSMNRHFSKEQTYDFVEAIRKEIPGIALRTSLIVGYPNESKQAYQELKKFIQIIQFDRLGVFTYSHEEDTRAYQLKDSITPKEKQKRADELMAIQQEISYALNQKKIDQTYRVLIDREEGDYYVGRTEFDSPEVDNEVLISKNKPVSVGQFYTVTITSADYYDLYASLSQTNK